MTSTVSYQSSSSNSPGASGPRESALLGRYQSLIDGKDFTWATRSRKGRLLGTGGQGVVYLAQRQGADGFTLPVALKVFSPELYRDARAYDEDMGRVAAVAARVALIQHDNLLYIHDFVAHDGVRIMGMEWVDGYDLRTVLTHQMLDRSQQRLPPERWRYVNDVILTAGASQPRFKPGVAIQVLRDCLAALAALHREGIAHGDLKPSNVMLKRTGNAKVIDIGSAMDLRSTAGRRAWSPAYAAPEVLEGGPVTPLSDLASLGYVLVEMLAGQPPFNGLTTYQELRDAKRDLESRLPVMLPNEVSGNELLMHLCQRLVATDPAQRFPSAQAAELGRKGAAAFHRQLVKGDLASEYDNDIRVWLTQLG